MCEFISAARRDLSLLLQKFQIRVPRDCSQRQHGPWPQRLQFALQISPAIQNLVRQGFIRRRRATHGSGNVCALQPQPIVAAQGSGLIRKSRFVQRLVQKIPRTIPSEYAACAVPTMGRGRQSQNEQFRTGISEARHRSSPIRPLPVGSPFLARHFFTVLHQSRTFPAGANFFADRSQRFFAVHFLPLSAAAISTAWFCFSSFRPYSSVTVPCSRSSRFTSFSKSFFFPSSSR